MNMYARTSAEEQLARSIKNVLYVPLQPTIFELPSSLLTDKKEREEEAERGR